jgi:IPT/TIG domain
MRYGALSALLAAIACTLVGAATAHTLSAPTIIAFAPKHGVVGTKVTIYGHDLAGAQVQFNGTQATKVSIDPMGTHVTAYVPPETMTGPGSIMVITPGGTVMSSAKFTVDVTGSRAAGQHASLRPGITGFMPTKSRVGAKVTIRGTHLGGAIWVEFGGVKAIFTVPSAQRIVATVPHNARTGKISVHTAVGNGTSRQRFVVLG